MQLNVSEDEKYAFILAWKAVIWKEIWSCMQTYCEHKNIPYCSNSLMKSMKFNTFSPKGIVNDMLPLLKRALNQGFLMPNEYKNNDNVKKAINLFGETFKISKSSIKEETAMKFISEYISKNIEKKEIKHDEDCSFCELIEVWDIDMNLYMPEDPYYLMLIHCLIKN